MRKGILIAIFVVGGMLLTISSVQAQTELQEIARQSSIKWQAERAYAESIAIAQKMPIRMEFEDGRIIELQSIVNGIPMYYTTFNLTAAKTISTNKVWPGGVGGYNLTGNGITLGEWDGGRVLTTHQEFTGRVTSTQGALSNHATHVAGTMIAAGVVGAARGMSYEASLKAFDWDLDESEMATEAAAGLRVSNHSYGTITGWSWNYRGDSRWAWFGNVTISTVEDHNFGFYSAKAQTWDNIAFNAPNYLIVRAAGNDRDEGPSGASQHWAIIDGTWTLITASRSRDGNAGYDCISHAGTAKNILTVGAVADIVNSYSNPSNVVMSTFSCWGPTDDGRIKPDIVANGIDLYSPISTTNSTYGRYDGTSMASPNASGSVGLLLQRQKMIHGDIPLLSSTLKAIIINTADEAGSNPGPDYSFGWGLMNTLKAVQLMTQDSIDGFGSHIKELVLSQGGTIQFDIGAEGASALRATICWTDLPGTTPSPSVDPTDLMLKNEVDLRIIKKRNQEIYRPWILNPASPSTAATKGDNFRDNVEQVHIESPERTTYTVRITHKGTLTGGSQKVSFAVSGNIVPLGPVFIAHPSNFEYNLIPSAIIHDSSKIKNNGDSLLIFRTSILPSDTGWLSISEDSVTINPLDSTMVHFTVDPTSLTTWTTYSGKIEFTNNDSKQNPFNFNVVVHVLGPTITSKTMSYLFEIDSGDVAKDTLVIRNDGYIPLHLSINDTGKLTPTWLTHNLNIGTIAPNESIFVALDAGSPTLALGDYYTNLLIESNDNKTGDINIPIALHVGTRRTISMQVDNRWNIVSLPVKSFLSLKTELFPTATSHAFSYNGIYVRKDILEAGQGYWLKFDTVQSIPIEGYVFNADTLPLLQGWNMIGALSNAIPTTAVVSEPDGKIAPYFFGYDRSYIIVDSLKPGKGYWVKAKEPCDIILSGTYPRLPKQSASHILSEFNSITFSDGENNQTLYFSPAVDGGINIEDFALPPTAPEGSFDVRYSSGRFLELIGENQSEYPINIQTASALITISWNIRELSTAKYVLRDEEGKTYPLNENGSITLHGDNSGIKTLKLVTEGKNIPIEYSLGQNYPNPFNPVTIVNYQLPIDNWVMLKVYDVLGREVAVLVDEFKDAGYYQATWDATNIPSGIYFYKMKTEKFTSVKKMLLLQ